MNYWKQSTDYSVIKTYAGYSFTMIVHIQQSTFQHITDIEGIQVPHHLVFSRVNSSTGSCP